jgi:hypothetical protein
MVMDYLRSCYSTKAVFKVGGHESGIKWYFAPDGALKFPHPHVFSSLNWCAPTCEPYDLGEVVGRPRPWSNGATPVEASGQGFCGDPDEFRYGIADYLADPRAEFPDGLPTCCPPICPPLTVMMGNITSGSYPTYTVASVLNTTYGLWQIQFETHVSDSVPFPPVSCGTELKVVSCNCPIPDGVTGGGARRYYWQTDAGGVIAHPGSCATWVGVNARYFNLFNESAFSITFTLGP